MGAKLVFKYLVLQTDVGFTGPKVDEMYDIALTLVNFIKI
jgi:hypothetical protein